MSLKKELAKLRFDLAKAAQQVYDEWEQDESGYDEELGYGGICQDVAEAMGGVILDRLEDVDILTQDSCGVGDQHVWAVAYNEEEAVLVDISPYTYESGGGYNWKKLPDVTIGPMDVYLEEVDRTEIDDDDW